MKRCQHLEVHQLFHTTNNLHPTDHDKTSDPCRIDATPHPRPGCLGSAGMPGLIQTRIQAEY
eukprot:scaffold246736_cov18-Tisochrysis_lutea.AAC.1